MKPNKLNLWISLSLADTSMHFLLPVHPLSSNKQKEPQAGKQQSKLARTAGDRQTWVSWRHLVYPYVQLSMINSYIPTASIVGINLGNGFFKRYNQLLALLAQIGLNLRQYKKSLALAYTQYILADKKFFLLASMPSWLVVQLIHLLNTKSCLLAFTDCYGLPTLLFR